MYLCKICSIYRITTCSEILVTDTEGKLCCLIVAYLGHCLSVPLSSSQTIRTQHWLHIHVHKLLSEQLQPNFPTLKKKTKQQYNNFGFIHTECISISICNQCYFLVIFLKSSNFLQIKSSYNADLLLNEALKELFIFFTALNAQSCSWSQLGPCFGHIK